MSRIAGRNTKPEIHVRSVLHRLGYRFRLHCTDLPGKPDITLSKYKAVVFVHGCFWHRHSRCKYAYTPKTNLKFWRGKFTDNLRRDRSMRRKLRRLGWQVIVIWECQTNDATRLAKRLANALSWTHVKSTKGAKRHGKAH
jgi:DNA mismatch endonuclease (patch repair protein)